MSDLRTAEHVHEWTDAPEDESLWYCAGCGLTECGQCPHVTPPGSIVITEEQLAVALHAARFQTERPASDREFAAAIFRELRRSREVAQKENTNG